MMVVIMLFAFVLGRESQLSLAEILGVCRANQISAKFIAASNELAIFDLDRFDPELFSRCGGLIKYGPVQAVPLPKLVDDVKALLSPNSDKKFHFGISVYAADDRVTRRELTDWQKRLESVGMQIRAKLRREGASVRFVVSQEPQLSSVVVTKNKLVSEQGKELIVGLGKGDEAWIGVTAAVQDFEEFSVRDYGRPSRDDVSGMLPPKLARMMINMAGVPLDEKTVLLDPFCGSGTVLQEAMMLGAGKALGSDVSSKAITDAQRNIDWLFSKQAMKGEVKIEQVDARELSSWLPERMVDLVVTEPFLGEPVKRKMAGADMVKRQQELGKLYAEVLPQIHRALKDGGRVVMVFPFIEHHRLPLPAGFQKQWEIEQPYKDIKRITSKRGGLDYQRPGQHVGREIFLLRKKS